MMVRFASSPIARGLLVAALILAASGALALASPEYVSDELAKRLVGIMLGVVVVVYSNAAPKALTPLALMRCDPAAEQSMRRFAGWALVLGGLGYAAVWLLAPLSNAGMLSVAVLGGALVAVVVRYAGACIIAPG